MLPVLIVHAIALAVTAIAAVTDARTGHIPNWLTLPWLVIAPAGWAFIAGREGVVGSLLGIALCVVVPYFLFRRGAMHGGDVKLFAALGGLLGMSAGLEAQILAYIVAGLYSLGALAWRGALLRTLGNALSLIVNPFLPRAKQRELKPELVSMIRLGIPILVGTLVALLVRHPELLLWRAPA